MAQPLNEKMAGSLTSQTDVSQKLSSGDWEGVSQ